MNTTEIYWRSLLIIKISASKNMAYHLSNRETGTKSKVYGSSITLLFVLSGCSFFSNFFRAVILFNAIMQKPLS